MFPDAVPVPAGRRALVYRVGRLEVGYPRGAAWLAETTGCSVQGVVLRPAGGGYTVVWGTPRAAPATHASVAEALQELFDLSVACDPAPWLAWFGAGDP